MDDPRLHHDHEHRGACVKSRVIGLIVAVLVGTLGAPSIAGASMAPPTTDGASPDVAPAAPTTTLDEGVGSSDPSTTTPSTTTPSTTTVSTPEPADEVLAIVAAVATGSPPPVPQFASHGAGFASSPGAFSTTTRAAAIPQLPATGAPAGSIARLAGLVLMVGLIAHRYSIRGSIRGSTS